jgi:hypothetical protein
MWVALSAVGLVACGGGGGASGTSPFGSGSGTTDSTGTTGVVSNQSASVVVNISPSNVISASAPGTVTALVKDASGNPIAGTIVTFTVSGTLAVVSPATVLTDATGSASTVVSPSSSSAVGATYVTAAADTAGGTLSTRLALSVSAVNVTLNSLTSTAPTVSAYGSTALDVNVTGASSSSPISVAFASTCAAAGKAVISPSTQVLSAATGSVTYQDKGCNSIDRISATIVGTSQQKTLDLTVQAPATQSIQFVSASPDTICLAGSGCSASSIVSFKVTDQFGNPVQGQGVDFALDIPGVADLSFVHGSTNSLGVVDVSVLSKTIPTPVRVKASVTGTALTTVSNVLAINAGLPTQNAMSFSAAAYNIDGMDKDGVPSAIRVQLNDRFGNPVPNGTAVSFVAEGASVIPARCTTADAVCAVTFVSSNFRPANGRVTVVAYAQGEESFSDTNGNNLFDAGTADTFSDLGEVFIDKNENSAMDAGEYIAGSPPNGVWDGNTYVRASRVFTLSSSATQPRLFEAIDRTTCSNVALAPFSLVISPVGSCRAQKLICVRDGTVAADGLGGNPVPVGTALSVSTKSNGAAVSIDNSPVSGVTTKPTIHVVTAELSSCTSPATTGLIDLQIQMPSSGPLYKTTIGTVN